MNSKKTNICLFFLLSFALGAIAQTAAKRTHKTPISTKNSVTAHFNMSTNSGASLTYQRKIAGSNKSYLSTGVGIASGNTAIQPTDLSAKAGMPSFSLPHNILYNYGNTNGHFAEIGVGAGYIDIFSVYKNANYNIYPLLGYRYQPTNSKLFVHLYICGNAI